jgi:hypothetical protein
MRAVGTSPRDQTRGSGQQYVEIKPAVLAEL